MRESRVALYELKKLYGRPVDFISYTEPVLDVNTGKVSRLEVRTSLSRVILVPKGQSFVLAQLVASKLGSPVEQDERTLILDPADLPSGSAVGLGDVAEINDDLYEVVKIEADDEDLVFVVIQDRKGKTING